VCAPLRLPLTVVAPKGVIGPDCDYPRDSQLPESWPRHVLLSLLALRAVTEPTEEEAS
jgi:hypothetical protein